MGKNLGRAIMSVGDDVARFSAASLRDQRERDIAELRSSVQLMIAEMRGTRAAGAGAGKDGGDGGFVPMRNDEEVAILANQGQQDPNQLATAADVQAGRRFLQQGPQTEVKATADTPGMEYLDPSDRQQLDAAGGMSGETTGSMAGRAAAKRVMPGLIGGMIDPKARDAFERGVTEATARQGAFSDDPAEQDKARRGQRAMKGDTRFGVDGDEKIDQMDPSGKGFLGQTEQGKAKTAAAKELGGLRERTPKIGGGKGGGGDDDAKDADVNRAVKEVADAAARMNAAREKAVKRIGGARVERRGESSLTPEQRAMIEEDPEFKAAREAHDAAKSNLDRINARAKGGSKAPAASGGGSGQNRRAPSIASIEGAPPGASIGSFVEGKGWQIKSKDGKTLGYAR